MWERYFGKGERLQLNQFPNDACDAIFNILCTPYKFQKVKNNKLIERKR